MYIVNFKPLLISNCQFKILRENSLLTTRERQTHARTLKTNPKGGIPQIRRVTSGSIKAYNKPTVHLEPTPQPGKIPKSRVKFSKTKALVEIDRTPNCDLKREMSR